MTTNIAIVYYSATGNVHALARALLEGAMEAGAKVRLRRVAEHAPRAAIDANPAWRAHADATAEVPLATHDDLRWADGIALGTPTRFGNVSSQLKQFIDTTGPLWFNGELAGKVVTGFTSAAPTAATRPPYSPSTTPCTTGALSSSLLATPTRASSLPAATPTEPPTSPMAVRRAKPRWRQPAIRAAD